MYNHIQTFVSYNCLNRSEKEVVALSSGHVRAHFCVHVHAERVRGNYRITGAARGTREE